MRIAIWSDPKHSRVVRQKIHPNATTVSADKVRLTSGLSSGTKADASTWRTIGELGRQHHRRAACADAVHAKQQQTCVATDGTSGASYVARPRWWSI